MHASLQATLLLLTPRLFTWILGLAICASVFSVNHARASENQQPSVDGENPRVLLTTSLGSIEMELLPKFAPLHVENFLKLVEEKFYDGLIFHRVVPNFMIQAGGFDVEMNYDSEDRRAIPNESFNGLKNSRGSVAMARLDDPDSANTQFFINVNNNDFLDATTGSPGYTVFGRVIDGYDVVEQIELVDTHLAMGMAGVP